jgi:hypothetical protein
MWSLSALNSLLPWPGAEVVEGSFSAKAGSEADATLAWGRVPCTQRRSSMIVAGGARGSRSLPGAVGSVLRYALPETCQTVDMSVRMMPQKAGPVEANTALFPMVGRLHPLVATDFAYENTYR